MPPRLFLKQGVGPTTIEQITSGAKVAKGTFYLYFSSKEDVLGALAGRFAQELLAKLKAAADEPQDGDWPAKLARWAAACVNGYLDSIRLHDILFYGAHAPSREGLTDNTVIDHLAGLLETGAAAGAWSIDDPRLTAVFMFSGLHATVDNAYVREPHVNRKRLIGRLQGIYFRMVGLPLDLLS